MVELTIPIVIAAALADSINPCVFGVLIFLIAFMTKVFKSKSKMLFGSLLYTAVVYITYLLIGFGILKFTVSFGFSVFVYWLAAVIAIGAGILEIKDYFWYGKGISLQMIPGAAERIKMYTKKMEMMKDKHISLIYLGMIAFGVFVVLVELPCTGAPYLAILALISQGDYARAIPLLLLYNLIFILPLLVIISIAYIGKTSKKLESWRKAHRGFIRLVIGIFLVALGSYMIYTVI